MLVRESIRRQNRVHGSSVAISCRVRLARNLSGVRFPDWADEAERRRVRQTLSRALLAPGCLPAAQALNIDELDEVAVQLLIEQRLISFDLSERGPGAGVVVSGDGHIAVMINEEDHLRIQVIEPGMDLLHAWETADELDTRLESHVAYAFSSRLGYLTACPSNVGTGLRASVMLHLLGLRLTGDIDAVLRSLDRMRLAVRGVGGEGSEAAGHMFQVSNQGTLGEDEASVIGGLSRIVAEVVRQERNARLRMLRDSPVVLLDCVARALVLLQHARVMQADEALDYLSALRLGLELGLLRRVTGAVLDELALAVQPGHLQQHLGSRAEPEQRDTVRADWLRGRLADVTLRE